MNVILATIKKRKNDAKMRLIQINLHTTSNYSDLVAGVTLFSTGALTAGVSFGVGRAAVPVEELFESVL